MRIVPKEEIQSRWDQWRLRQLKKARKNDRADLIGLGLTVRLEDGRSLVFRGRKFEVPPVPWRVALAVIEADEAFKALQKEKAPRMADWLALYKGVGRLFKQAARPASWWRRILWPITPSPLRSATPSEVGECLRFFSLCLIMDHGASHLGSLRPGTSPRSSAASSLTSRNGARTAPLAAGSIS